MFVAFGAEVKIDVMLERGSPSGEAWPWIRQRSGRSDVVNRRVRAMLDADLPVVECPFHLENSNVIFH